MSVPKKPAADADKSSHDDGPQAAVEDGQRPKEGEALSKYSKAARRRARATGGGALMEWCNKWFKNPPEGDLKEHVKMARADFARYGQKAVDEIIEEGIDKRIDKRIEEGIEADIEARIDARIDARMKRYDKEETEKQIMVENFKVFRREYINMAIRRSC